MTDLFRGFDLSVVADIVVRKNYERIVAGALANAPHLVPPAWEDLTPVQKHNMKSNLLPIISDTIDALQDSKVQPPAPKVMIEYGYLDGDRADPRFYENQDAQLSKETATVWALHLNPDGDNLSTRDLILNRMAETPHVTGEYTYGDSWREWGAETEWAADRHMVIYFEAETPEQAEFRGNYLAMCAAFAAKDFGLVEDYAISASGDYAEIIR